MLSHIFCNIIEGGDIRERTSWATRTTIPRHGLVHTAGHGLKDGNSRDNFEMPRNIDKIFGMLEDLIVTSKATKHFFIYAKQGPDMYIVKRFFSTAEIS